jgi:hypothetical protein
MEDENENENENESEYSEDKEYEDNKNDGESKGQDENVEHRHAKKYKQPAKRPTAKHHEMITTNAIHQQLVSLNSNL